MLADRIEGKWIDAFCEVFERCAVKRGETAAILSETQSRQLNVQIAELALLRLGARPFHIVVTTPRNAHPVPVRSTGASEAIGKLSPRATARTVAKFRMVSADPLWAVTGDAIERLIRLTIAIIRIRLDMEPLLLFSMGWRSAAP